MSANIDFNIVAVDAERVLLRVGPSLLMMVCPDEIDTNNVDNQSCRAVLYWVNSDDTFERLDKPVAYREKRTFYDLVLLGNDNERPSVESSAELRAAVLMVALDTINAAQNQTKPN